MYALYLFNLNIVFTKIDEKCNNRFNGIKMIRCVRLKLTPMKYLSKNPFLHILKINENGQIQEYSFTFA